MIKEEILNFQGILNKNPNNLDRGELLSILIYVLVYTGTEDLTAQLTLISNFISDKVKYGHSRLSASFTDFKNAVDFLNSLEISNLEKYGTDYLLNVQIDSIKSRKFCYPKIVEEEDI